MKKTIFFGNGINMLSDGYSWNGMLSSLSKRTNIDQISSNLLKYEYIVLSEPCYTMFPWSLNGKLLLAGDKVWCMRKDTEYDILRAKMCKELQTFKRSSFYYDLAKLNIQNYITTNYELYLKDIFSECSFKVTAYYENESRIFSKYIAQRGQEEISLWNIHGDVYHPKSIIIGFSEYCKYISEIENYLGSTNYEKDSWLMLFLTTDVYILGFGLVFEELDLWYLLICRKRIRRTCSNDCLNSIYYFSITKEDGKESKKDISIKKELLETLDVVVIEVPFIEEWKEAYQNVFKQIGKDVGYRKI